MTQFYSSIQGADYFQIGGSRLGNLNGNLDDIIVLDIPLTSNQIYAIATETNGVANWYVPNLQ